MAERTFAGRRPVGRRLSNWLSPLATSSAGLLGRLERHPSLGWSLDSRCPSESFDNPSAPSPFRRCLWSWRRSTSAPAKLREMARRKDRIKSSHLLFYWQERLCPSFRLLSLQHAKMKWIFLNEVKPASLFSAFPSPKTPLTITTRRKINSLTPIFIGKSAKIAIKSEFAFNRKKRGLMTAYRKKWFQAVSIGGKKKTIS